MTYSRMDLSNIVDPLRSLYPQLDPPEFERCFRMLLQQVESAYQVPSKDALWTERDSVLITYGDQVRTAGEVPIQTLQLFFSKFELFDLINTVHFLPCFPYSSDDGFAVIDYLQIDPDLGTWDDVRVFSDRCHLMLDFVVNHISQQSDWFQGYLKGDREFENYFIEADPVADYTKVARPRSLPLLSEFDTVHGKRWLWTTFSRDQIDLNFADPAVLARALDILLHYVRRGARIIRLDAIAYLWKEVGTECIHLPQTHAVIKLMRAVLSHCSPRTLLLTETNVPHSENVSYFGNGDEAHMVYQFSLPPLLLDATLNADAQPLKHWLAHLEAPPDGCTFFNFTASHDGIGVRPLEGHVDTQRLTNLIEQIRRRGGLISSRSQSDGTESPYELNISYVDAVSDPDLDLEFNVRRFLTTQAFAMALQGIPAIYFHSLVGTQNDLVGVERSGIHRRINRRKFDLDELLDVLNRHDSMQSQIFVGMKQLLEVRMRQPAFHPNAKQRYLESHTPHGVCFERTCHTTSQSILVAANFAMHSVSVRVPSGYARSVDLLNSDTIVGDDTVLLDAAQIVWLEKRS